MPCKALVNVSRRPPLPRAYTAPTRLNRQSHDQPGGLTYMHSIRKIIKKDGGGVRGVLGVLGRGLGGRVAASALQVKAWGPRWTRTYDFVVYLEGRA